MRLLLLLEIDKCQTYFSPIRRHDERYKLRRKTHDNNLQAQTLQIKPEEKVKLHTPLLVSEVVKSIALSLCHNVASSCYHWPIYLSTDEGVLKVLARVLQNHIVSQQEQEQDTPLKFYGNHKEINCTKSTKNHTPPCEF